MKKILLHLFLFTFLAFNGKVFAQSGTDTFIPGINPPIPVLIASQQQIKISSIDGLIGTNKAIELVIQNVSKNITTFSCKIKDKEGKTLFTISNVVLNPGQSIGGPDDKVWMEKLYFLLPAGVSASDLTTEITF